MPKRPAKIDWDKRAADLLVGRTVKAASYMTAKEAEQMGWDQRPLVIEFDNGLVIYASQDDEGNGPGALFTNSEKEPGFPVAY